MKRRAPLPHISVTSRGPNENTAHNDRVIHQLTALPSPTSARYATSASARSNRRTCQSLPSASRQVQRRGNKIHTSVIRRKCCVRKPVSTLSCNTKQEKLFEPISTSHANQDGEDSRTNAEQ